MQLGLVEKRAKSLVHTASLGLPYQGGKVRSTLESFLTSGEHCWSLLEPTELSSILTRVLSAPGSSGACLGQATGAGEGGVCPSQPPPDIYEVLLKLQPQTLKEC